MGNFQSVEVGEELTVSSSQSKDCDLKCPEVVPKCGLCFAVGHGVCRLLHFASYF